MNQESIGMSPGYRNEPGFIVGQLNEQKIIGKAQPLTEYIDVALLNSLESLMQQFLTLECKLLPVIVGGAAQNPLVPAGGHREKFLEISPASEVRLKLKNVENELNELSRRIENLTRNLDI